MKTLIKNAEIINHDKTIKGDILIENGIIEKIGKDLQTDKAKEIDASEKMVFPGFVDLHVHFRTPGREDKETIETGSQAAVKGGYTTVMCMPNTEPAIDTYEVAQSIKKASGKTGLLEVIPVGAFTKGRKGDELSDIGLLKEAGCLALSDDGCSVANSRVFRRALEYAKKFDLIGICHCEEPDLAGKGVIKETSNSAMWGIPSVPEIAETVFVARDIELARYLDVRLHLAHISTARSVQMIRRAKQDGIKITAETAPHYLILTIDDIEKDLFDSKYKVNPPIGSEYDRQALIEGLKDGTIDCIATDHAPHTKLDKEGTFIEAAFGMIGLEMSFSLCLKLVEQGLFTFNQLSGFLSYNPANLIGLCDRGYIAEGLKADITIVDTDRKWPVTEETIMSKSRNTPFLGKELKGMITHTIYNGKIVYKA